MLARAQQAVREFHYKFDFTIPDKPTLLPSERIAIRAKWLREEIQELEHAINITDQADAAADIIYFALGIFVEMGIEGSEVFNLVHQANMQKLDAQGQLMRDPDGKILKPEGWVSPKEKIRAWLEGTKTDEI